MTTNALILCCRLFDVVKMNQILNEWLFKKQYEKDLEEYFRESYFKLKKFFKGFRHSKAAENDFQRKINQPADEDNKYIPLCARAIFYENAVFSGDDPSLSSLDKKVMPHFVAGSLFGVLDCNPTCPGYNPIPVEEFPFMNMTRIKNYNAKCSRSYPPPIKDYSVEEWKKLRADTLKLIEDDGKTI